MSVPVWSTALPANHGGSVACSVRLERTVPSVVNVEARMKDPRQGKPFSAGESPRVGHLVRSVQRLEILYLARGATEVGTHPLFHSATIFQLVRALSYNRIPDHHRIAMPSVRTKLECAKPLLKNVKGMLFSHAYRAFAVDVPTAIHPTRDCLAVPRFPCFETILGAGLEIYETWVTSQNDLGPLDRFLIAAHYDPAREINTALKTIVPNTTWRGDLIVMRGGTAVFVVNMGGSECRELATRAVRTFLLEAIPLVAAALRNHERINIPTYM